MKIVKSLEESDLYVKSVRETIEKGQKGRFLSFFRGPFGVSYLGSLLSGNELKWERRVED